MVESFERQGADVSLTIVDNELFFSGIDTQGHCLLDPSLTDGVTMPPI
jgi:hypothetical protein